MIKFCVITEVPDPEADDGNLSAGLIYPRGDNPGKPNAETLKQIQMGALFYFGIQVFELGEIIVMDSKSGREIGGAARKPSKWSIGCETFDNIQEAIKRSAEVMRE